MRPAVSPINARTSLPAASPPNSPSSTALPPNAAMLRATLPAPPSMLWVRFNSSTGTGASGEMRSLSQ